MASATNRNLQAKYLKAKQQIRELAHAEYTKAPYLVKHDFPSCEGVMVRRIAEGVTSKGRGMARVFRQHF